MFPLDRKRTAAGSLPIILVLFTLFIAVSIAGLLALALRFGLGCTKCLGLGVGARAALLQRLTILQACR